MKITYVLAELVLSLPFNICISMTSESHHCLLVVKWFSPKKIKLLLIFLQENKR